MSRRVTVVVALLVAAALAAGALAGVALTGRSQYVVPLDASVDAGFARDMQAHHGQAVDLSLMVRDRTQDPDVRTLALDILLTQQHQAGQMAGWLETWGLPQGSRRPAMAWAGEGHDHAQPGTTDPGTEDPDALAGFAAMPGWVSREDLARLDAAEGVDAERLFLELMIPHHRGGVEMAEMAVDTAQSPQVRALARAIVRSQEAEVTVLQRMLDARGGPLS